MKIELTQYQENEDGSVNCHVDMDKEATHHLINHALVNMLTKAVEEGKLYTPDAYVAEAEEEAEEEVETEEEEDVNYFYDEDEDVEYYYVEDEGIWYYYDEDEDDWLVVDDEEDEDEEEEEEDDKLWVALSPDQLDLFFVKELKRGLTNSYENNLFHQEDIDDNLRVRNALKTLLNYYMIPSEADEYIGLIESVYEFEGA